jgi:hypothetical protein
MLIKDLIHIPERVHHGDFVLKLTDGIDHAARTLDDYVVTPRPKQKGTPTNCCMADYFAEFLAGELRTLALTPDALRAWRPPQSRRGRRRQ